MFSTTWLKDAAERAIKSFAQILLSVLTLNGADVLTLDWKQALSLAVTGLLASVLTSVVSAGVGSAGTASLTKAVEAAPADGRHEAG